MLFTPLKFCRAEMTGVHRRRRASKFVMSAVKQKILKRQRIQNAAVNKSLPCGFSYTDVSQVSFLPEAHSSERKYDDNHKETVTDLHAGTQTPGNESCCVKGCPISTDSRTSTGASYVLYEVPVEIGKRRLWSLYVPDIDVFEGEEDDQTSRKYFVCQLHFIEGQPTVRHPYPTQNLRDPSQNASKEPQIIAFANDRCDKFSAVRRSTEPTDNTVTISFQQIHTDTLNMRSSKRAIICPDQKANCLGRSFAQNPDSASAIDSGLSSAQKWRFLSKADVSKEYSCDELVNHVAQAEKPDASASSALKLAQQVSPVEERSLPSIHPNEHHVAAPCCQRCNAELAALRNDVRNLTDKVDSLLAIVRRLNRVASPSANGDASKSGSSVARDSPRRLRSVQRRDSRSTDDSEIKSRDINEAASVPEPIDAKREYSSRLAKKKRGRPRIFREPSVGSNGTPLANPRRRTLNRAAHRESPPDASHSENDRAKRRKTSPVSSTNACRNITSTASLGFNRRRRPSSFPASQQGAPLTNGVLSSDRVARQRRDTWKDASAAISTAQNGSCSSEDASLVSYQRKRVDSAEKCASEKKETAANGIEINTLTKDIVNELPETKPNQFINNYAVARAALLFAGRGFTAEHLKAYGPSWLSGISEQELQVVLQNLVEEKILKPIGSREVPWKSESGCMKTMSVYKKMPPDETDSQKLSKYRVSANAYASSYTKKSCPTSAYINVLCDLDD